MLTNPRDILFATLCSNAFALLVGSGAEDYKLSVCSHLHFDYLEVVRNDGNALLLGVV